MIRVVLRGFLQRRVRALLTGIAIALGVALMAGTYILTDTITHSFGEIFSSAYANKAVVVTERETLGRGSGQEASVMDAQTIARVRAVPGVAAASGTVHTVAALLTTSGKRLTTGGAPGLVEAVQPARFEAFTAAAGHLPRTGTEVAIDQASAKRNHLRVGQQIVIAGRAPARRYTISAIARYAGSESFGGAVLALVTIGQAQYIANEGAKYDGIYVANSSGVSPGELARRVRAALPSNLVVRTGAQEATNQTEELEEKLGSLRTILLIFAYVALVAGAFVIFNTISITVTQRTRELGLLRTLGASRGQIMRSVALEGLMLGVLGALAGLFIGIGLAPALDGLFRAFGAELPDNGTVLEARTVIVSLLVGILVTVLAGFFPALRATRVPPVAAMREGVSIPPAPIPSRRVLIVRFAILLLVVVGVSLVSKGVGILLLVVVLIRAARLRYRLKHAGEQRRYRVVPALGRGIGRLVSWRGVMGRLATENSIRQPGRTLTTALALTVGLGLIAFVAIFNDSVKASIDKSVEQSFTGDLIVHNRQEGQGGIPASTLPALQAIHGVGVVSAVAFTEGQVRDLAEPGAPALGEKTGFTAIEPSFVKTYQAEWEHGSESTFAALGETGTVVKKTFATEHHLKVGQRLSVLTPSGRHVTLTVRGILKPEVLGLLQALTISRSLARSAFGVREDGVDLLSYSPGANAGEVRESIDALLRGSYPQAKSQTANEYTGQVSKTLNRLLIFIGVLLALSIVVSLFGIINTLILSIYERTRELGMMRAIGTSRRQVREMIRYESIITSLIGGVLGLVLGLLGATVVYAIYLTKVGFSFAVPVGTLALLILAAGLIGLFAAQLPARRAARLDVVAAISAE